jgi:hypothetical protein
MTRHQDGWRVKTSPRFGQKEADLLVSCQDSRFVVELKVASEGRRDRLVPLLAQAILQARAIAQASPQPAVPLAVISAPLISPSIVGSLKDFLAESAPDAAAGCRKRSASRARYSCSLRRAGDDIEEERGIVISWP